MSLRSLPRSTRAESAAAAPEPGPDDDQPLDALRRCAPVVHAVMGMRRVEFIVLRWSGLRAHNAVASFPSLALGSAAVQSLAHLPLAVSAVVCSYATRDGDRFVAVVGAHAADRHQRDRAARELAEHGGRGVVLFEGEAPDGDEEGG